MPASNPGPVRIHELVPQREARATDPRLHATEASMPPDGGATPELTLVAPVYNELDNLVPLLDKVRQIFGERTRWELVLVDDGSTDGSTERIGELADAELRLRPVYFGRNCGQTTAMSAGIQAARGPILATLDADLQNDPADLPRMITALEGHDAVVGYRVGRKDTVVRRASSRIANWIRNRLTGDQIRDTGCSLKVFRREAIRSIPLFEGMHRFLPTLLRMHGYDVIEFPVSHHPRIHGKSKYGVRNRALRAFRDLMAVRWMRTRIVRPPIVEREVARARARASSGS
jgi:glycosyltransferase involved in cell wall biosynthesis